MSATDFGSGQDYGTHAKVSKVVIEFTPEEAPHMAALFDSQGMANAMEGMFIPAERQQLRQLIATDERRLLSSESRARLEAPRNGR